MRILHVNNSAEGGGTETYIQRIIASLNRRDHVNELYVQHFTSGNHPLLALQNTRSNIRRLQSIIDGFNPDVIHIHNINNFHILNFLLNQKPCLKSVHEFRPFCTTLRVQPHSSAICDDYLSMKCFKAGCFSLRPGSVYRFLADRKAIRVIRRFKAIWVMSRFMQRMIEPVLPDTSVVEVVPYFYDPPDKITKVIPREPRIFTAGRLVAGKGFDRLMEILSLVKSPFEMRIAGDGEARSRLQAMAQDRQLNIEFLGHLPADCLAEHYAWSCLVVFPSTYPEPFGIVGLEAMGAARPVVAFDVGGIRDWLEDGQTGYCIPPYELETFAKKIDALLTDDAKTQSFGDNGRKRLLACFSSDRHTDRLIATYQRIIEQAHKVVFAK